MRTDRTLALAFVGAIVVPCGLLAFFGVRAMEMEAQVARTRREARLKNAATLLARQVDVELRRLRDRAADSMWPLREPVFERETAEKSVADLVASDPRLKCGVLFDSSGRVIGPDLALPFRRGPARAADVADTVLFVRPGETLELAEARIRRTLGFRQALDVALAQEKSGEDPASVLRKVRLVEEKSEDENLRAQAALHAARIRLSLGGAREAAMAAESFVSRGVMGPRESGLAVRGRMFLIWSEAWLSLGSLGRALEILFWFWSELLEGKFDVDEAAFASIEEDLAGRAASMLDSAQADLGQWRERIGRFRRQGAEAREAAAERSLLENEVLPRVTAEGFGEGATYFRALLQNRLELFLYVPPASFESGLRENAAAGAGFRIDTDKLFSETVSPLMEAFSASEVSIAVSDHDGRTLSAGSPSESGVETPLLEPLGSWRVIASPGTSDPEGRRARAQTAFGAALILTSAVAVVAAGLFLLRTYRRQAQLAALRSDFVSVVTHDLKTPITSIRVLIDTLRMGRARDEERARKYFELIASESERLERLIDDILAFARIEAGTTFYAKQLLDLKSIVLGVVESFKPGAEAAGFEIEVTAGDTPPLVGDADALKRALWNLLSNAMKFSAGNKWVGIGVFERAGSAVIEVRDRGMGISPRDMERIFDKFYRSAESMQRQLPGTGLGLALVRHVVNGHNGTIEVESRLSEGATFRLVIPAAPDSRDVRPDEENSRS